jgi:hypothetical protein
MKSILMTICVIIIVFIWAFPIIISFYTFNFWYIMLYFIWWLPSMIFSKMISIIFDNL